MSSSRSHHRFAWAYQFAAVGLLLLVTVPFTAPWAAYDVAHDLTHNVLQSAPDESCDSVKSTVTHDGGLSTALVSLPPATFRLPGITRRQSASAAQSVADRQPVPLRL